MHEITCPPQAHRWRFRHAEEPWVCIHCGAAQMDCPHAELVLLRCSDRVAVCPWCQQLCWIEQRDQCVQPATEELR